MFTSNDYNSHNGFEQPPQVWTPLNRPEDTPFYLFCFFPLFFLLVIFVRIARRVGKLSKIGFRPFLGLQLLVGK